MNVFFFAPDVGAHTLTKKCLTSRDLGVGNGTAPQLASDNNRMPENTDKVKWNKFTIFVWQSSLLLQIISDVEELYLLRSWGCLKILGAFVLVFISRLSESLQLYNACASMVAFACLALRPCSNPHCWHFDMLSKTEHAHLCCFFADSGKAFA